MRFKYSHKLYKYYYWPVNNDDDEEEPSPGLRM